MSQFPADSGAVGGKVPPHNIEAERSLLGTLLVNPEAIARVVDIVRPESFYRENHRLIYEAMLELFKENEPIDLVTVSEKLKSKGLLDRAGGYAYLVSLTETVPMTANPEEYARLVEEKALLRELIRAGSKIIDLGYQEDRNVEDVLDEAEQTVFEIAQRRVTPGYEAVYDILFKRFDVLMERSRAQTHTVGVPTGFRQLDEIIGGFLPTELIIIAARPGVGKTAFCLNVALNATKYDEAKKPILFFSLEMSKEQIAERILSAVANIDAFKFRRPWLLTDDEWRELTRAASELKNVPIYIDDTPGITILEIRARARRIKAEKGALGLVIVDYLQLVKINQRVESRVQEVSMISQGLKALAKELSVPVIAVSQLSRAVEQRQDKRPVLSDLRESGALEQDADIVIFLHRNMRGDRRRVEQLDFEEGTGSLLENEVEVIVAKHRHGPTGTTKLHFEPRFLRFEEIAA